MQLDLYGNPLRREPRRSKTTPARGYIMPPGTGPTGETCGSCAHKTTKNLGNKYHKCLLFRPWWTGGRGTDVLVRTPACIRWDPVEQ